MDRPAPPRERHAANDPDENPGAPTVYIMFVVLLVGLAALVGGSLVNPQAAWAVQPKDTYAIIATILGGLAFVVLQTEVLQLERRRDARELPHFEIDWASVDVTQEGGWRLRATVINTGNRPSAIRRVWAAHDDAAVRLVGFEDTDRPDAEPWRVIEPGSTRSLAADVLVGDGVIPHVGSFKLRIEPVHGEGRPTEIRDGHHDARAQPIPSRSRPTQLPASAIARAIGDVFGQKGAVVGTGAAFAGAAAIANRYENPGAFGAGFYVLACALAALLLIRPPWLKAAAGAAFGALGTYLVYRGL